MKAISKSIILCSRSYALCSSLFNRKLLFALCSLLSALCLLSSVAWAATYYVDATNGDDYNDGISEVTAWKTIAKVNASRFSPGDQILFKKGEIWREQLTVPSSGSAGSPITFGAYGTGAKPIISGADVISGFVNGGSSIWDKTGVTTQPKVVIFGETLGTVAANRAGCTSAGKWFWTGNTLSVYATSDPSGTIQAGQRDFAVVVSKSYITISGLHVEAGNRSDYGGNIFFYGSTHPSNLILDNIDSRWSANSGIAINTTGFSTGGSVTVRNSIIHDNLEQGFAAIDDMGSTVSTPSVIQYCDIYNNHIDGMSLSANYWTVEHNTVRDNGIPATLGSGIHTYSSSAGAGFGQHITIRYNTISNQSSNDQDGAGIGLDQWCDYSDVYYNVIYNTFGAGIYLYDNSHSRVYNNTIYNTSTDGKRPGGIRATATSDSYSTDTIIKNNNVFSVVSGDLAIFVDAHYITNGITVANNNFYRASGSWYWWDGTSGSNLATFNALPGVSANINSDPLFVSTSTPDFHLQSNSPCINSAVNVGLMQDHDGNDVPFGPAPDIGAYEWKTVLSPPRNVRIIP